MPIQQKTTALPPVPSRKRTKSGAFSKFVIVLGSVRIAGIEIEGENRLMIIIQSGERQDSVSIKVKRISESQHRGL